LPSKHGRSDQIHSTNLDSKYSQPDDVRQFFFFLPCTQNEAVRQPAHPGPTPAKPEANKRRDAPGAVTSHRNNRSVPRGEPGATPSFPLARKRTPEKFQNRSAQRAVFEPDAAGRPMGTIGRPPAPDGGVGGNATGPPDPVP
jgi:hypothetical protein